MKARDFLEGHYTEAVSSQELEAITGLDRYELARHFRRLLGTSPYRYLTLRRLDQAKRLLAQGDTLADTAAQTGFADQAHFTRQFHKTFGMPPGRWRGLRMAR